MIVCNGLYMLPYEGLHLYRKWVDPTPGWDGMDSVSKWKALHGEMDALYQGMKKAYIRRRAAFFNKEYLNSIHHKQLRVWYTVYEMFGYSAMLGESKGNLAFFSVMMKQPCH